MDGNHDPLESSYTAFNRLSEELSSAYLGLAERAAGLEAELARSRHEKERQREEKEHLADRLAALLDSLPGGVVVYASAGCVTASNAVARDWFGADLQDRRWDELLASGNLRRLDDGRELEAADGRQLVMSQRYVPGREETIVLLTDVTEERRLQAEVEQSRRLATMGEMAARLAHQIRTPLAKAQHVACGISTGSHATCWALSAPHRVVPGTFLCLRSLMRSARPSTPRSATVDSFTFTTARSTGWSAAIARPSPVHCAT